MTNVVLACHWNEKAPWENEIHPCPWKRYCMTLGCNKVERIAAKILNDAFNSDLAVRGDRGD